MFSKKQIWILGCAVFTSALVVTATLIYVKIDRDKFGIELESLRYEPMDVKPINNYPVNPILETSNPEVAQSSEMESYSDFSEDESVAIPDEIEADDARREMMSASRKIDSQIDSALELAENMTSRIDHVLASADSALMRSPMYNTNAGLYYMEARESGMSHSEIVNSSEYIRLRNDDIERESR